jgi:hypothetical protein
MFFQCWLEVTKQQRYRDKWLSDETYFRAIKAYFTTSKCSFAAALQGDQPFWIENKIWIWKQMK